MGSKVVRTEFGSGLICLRAQTCMDSKVVRTEFGSGLICLRAQTCCASPTRTPSRLANSPEFKSFRCPRWRIKFSLERFSDLSHICLSIQPLESSLGRVPQAPRLSHAPRLDSGVLARIRLRTQPLKNSAGRVPQAADGTCNKNS